jgi:putative DNA primase/helicase
MDTQQREQFINKFQQFQKVIEDPVRSSKLERIEFAKAVAEANKNEELSSDEMMEYFEIMMEAGIPQHEIIKNWTDGTDDIHKALPAMVDRFWLRDSKGRLTKDMACDQLASYFEHTHKYKTHKESHIVYIFNGKYWEQIADSEIDNFCYSQMDWAEKNRRCGLKQVNEFKRRILSTNLVNSDWFHDGLEGKFNLLNGVYDINTGNLSDHDPKFAFRYVLPYEYDPHADCPRFKTFLREVTCNREDLQEILIRYCGYAIAGGECRAEKALFLYGPSASNGKSTFVNVIREVVGKDNCAPLSLGALNSDTKRCMLDGKLVNFGEETSSRALVESHYFKTMVTGGEIDVKKLYKNEYVIQNRCKLVVLCNDLPTSNDRSDGLYRRMLIIPFDAKFEGVNKDANIKDKLHKELPGIFNMFVQGYKRLAMDDWQFPDSLTVRNQLEAYKQENDNALEYMSERIVMWATDKEQCVGRRDLYNDYREWCQESGHKPFSNKKFFTKIYSQLPEQSRDHKKDITNAMGIRTKQRVVCYVSFKEKD